MLAEAGGGVPEVLVEDDAAVAFEAEVGRRGQAPFSAAVAAVPAFVWKREPVPAFRP